jgi:hypothetical protein
MLFSPIGPVVSLPAIFRIEFSFISPAGPAPKNIDLELLLLHQQGSLKNLKPE